MSWYRHFDDDEYILSWQRRPRFYRTDDDYIVDVINEGAINDDDINGDYINGDVINEYVINGDDINNYDTFNDDSSPQMT